MSGKGQLIVISSPSGGGKTTICNELLQQVPGLARAVTATTRGIRPGEVEGKDYHFLTKEDFEKKKQSGGFYEWAEVHGNYYGTPRDEVDRLRAEGKSVVLVIDVQGAASIKKIEPETRTIFVLPPGESLEEQKQVLKQRLVARATDAPEVVEQRLEEAGVEINRRDEFDFSVVNDDLAETTKKIRKFLTL